MNEPKPLWTGTRLLMTRSDTKAVFDAPSVKSLKDIVGLYQSWFVSAGFMMGIAPLVLANG